MSEHEIFARALEIQDISSRNEFLQQECRDDPSLRARVERLLAAVESRKSFMEIDETDVDDLVSMEVGKTIGPYTLKEKIGEGGMGVVYVAEQKKPIRRRVALKVIKPGLDSQQVIARFESERETLALLDHPNITRVFDGGTTDQGLPYIVMELVNGDPITKYCDENRLTIHQRLKLFLEVCAGVQHAHQKGVIHRDLKPSNILIAKYDGKPVPKVIDFGVAKALGKSLGDMSVYTHFGQILGTFEYMSPEQAQRNQLDVDTRSDVYALGVLLYELLTGELPFDRERLRSCALDEMFRIIREEEAVKPSTRLSTAGSSEAAAGSRNIEPEKLATYFRGELDWIALKALNKERQMRYESANAFARDIQNYLEGNPVEACPPSTSYRLKKWARKNRAAITVACLFVALLTIGTTVSVWQAIRATRANADAQKFLAELKSETQQKTRLNSELKATLQVVKQEKQNTELERARVIRSFNFIKDMINSTLSRGVESSVGDLVVEISNSVDEEFAHFPKTKADILLMLTGLYHRTGDHRLRNCGRRCLDAIKAAYPPDSQYYILEISELGTLSFYSDASAQERLELAQQQASKAERLFGESHPVTLRCLKNVYERYQELQMHSDGVQVLEKIDRAATTKNTEFSIVQFDVEMRMTVKELIVREYQNMGRYEDASDHCEQLLRIAMSLANANPTRHNYIQEAVNGLAYSAGKLGDYKDSIRVLEDYIPKLKKLGVQTSGITLYIATIEEHNGQLKDALKTIDGLLNEKTVRKFLEDPFEHFKKKDLAYDVNPRWLLRAVLNNRIRVAMSIWDRDGNDEELTKSTIDYETNIEGFGPILGKNSLLYVSAGKVCGHIYYRLGQYSKAAGFYKDLVPFTSVVDYRKPKEDDIEPSVYTELADCLIETGELEEAVHYLNEARPVELELLKNRDDKEPRSLIYLNHVAAFANFKLNQVDEETGDLLAQLVIHDYEKLTADEIEEQYRKNFHLLQVQLIRNISRLIEFLEASPENADKLAVWRERLDEVEKLENPNLKSVEKCD